MVTSTEAVNSVMLVEFVSTTEVIYNVDMVLERSVTHIPSL